MRVGPRVGRNDRTDADDLAIQRLLGLLDLKYFSTVATNMAHESFNETVDVWNKGAGILQT